MGSVECNAAIANCAGTTTTVTGETNIVTNPEQAAIKAATTSEAHSYLQQLYIKGEDRREERREERRETVVVTDSKTKCPAAVSVCTATGDKSVECQAAKEQCVADLKAKRATEVVTAPTLDTICVPAQSVCTATGMGSVECKAAIANCAGSEAVVTPTVVVTDSATKCPAAVSVCTATGDASAECTAAKEQCVADLAAKKVTTGEVRVHRDRNIITNPRQAELKAERTSRRHSY